MIMSNGENTMPLPISTFIEPARAVAHYIDMLSPYIVIVMILIIQVVGLLHVYEWFLERKATNEERA